MLRKNLLAVFDAGWLPVLILISTTWLYAPWLHDVTPRHLAVISTYETTGSAYSWLFRAGDFGGAVLILAVIWRSRLFAKQRWTALNLALIALLIVIDIVFVIGCTGNCTAWDSFSTGVHYIESVASVLALLVATAVDAFQRKSVFSRIFFMTQLLAATAIFLPFVDRQYLIMTQYIYQVCFVAWIGYVLRRHMPRPAWPWRLVVRLRTTLAVLVFIAGLLELLMAFHLRSYGRIPGELLLHGEPVWLAEHGVVASLVMLYLARYIYKGERRAAIIIGLVTATLIAKYAVLTPNAVSLVFSELIALMLWVSWPSFNRNTGTPPLVSKLRGLAVVLAGIAVAGGLMFSLALATGRQQLLVGDLLRQSSASAVKFEQVSGPRSRLRYRIEHTREVTTGLAVALASLVVLVLFQPSGRKPGEHALDAAAVEALLSKYATSSEDFFKLWPADKSYFSIPETEGFIAYKKVSNTAFALADPVCRPGDQAVMLAKFVDHCRRRGWSACFLVVNESALPLYKAASLSGLQIGSNAVIPVADFAASTVRDKWWRWQLNRAAKAGKRYEVSQPPHSQALLTETRRVSDAWLGRAGHGEQGFALGYYDEEAYLQRCVLHLLRSSDGQLEAFTNQLPVYNQLQMTTVDLIRFMPESTGAMPVLIANLILEINASQEFQSFDLGFVPLAKVDTVVAKIARRLSAGRFSAAGLEQFKGKFKPDWQPQYLVYDGDLIDLTALLSRLQKALSVDV